MRFKEFLNESSAHSSFEYHEIVGLIAQDCKYFLEESKGLHLLRGIRHASSRYFHTPQPKNRTAVDSDQGFNAFFNIGFEAAFDEPDIRKNSFFASGSEAFVSEYGPVFYIFPKGDFSFAFSKDISDSWTLDEVFYNDMLDKLRHIPHCKHLGTYDMKKLFASMVYFLDEQGVKNVKFDSDYLDDAIHDAIEANGKVWDVKIPYEYIDEFKSVWKETFQKLYTINCFRIGIRDNVLQR